MLLARAVQNPTSRDGIKKCPVFLQVEAEHLMLCLHAALFHVWASDVKRDSDVKLVRHGFTWKHKHTACQEYIHFSMDPTNFVSFRNAFLNLCWAQLCLFSVSGLS